MIALSCREELLKTNAQLWMRRKQLVNDFATVYPIVEVSGLPDHWPIDLPCLLSFEIRLLIG